MGIKATNNRIFEERDEVNISFLENVINYLTVSAIRYHYSA